jgi:hypothetical protein
MDVVSKYGIVIITRNKGSVEPLSLCFIYASWCFEYYFVMYPSAMAR